MTETAPRTDARPAVVPAPNLPLRPHPPEGAGPVDSPQTAQLRRALARLAALRHPNLAPVHSISQRGVRFVLEHSVPAGATSWSQLTAQRRATVGEAATVGLAVAAALTALHDADLAHGAVAGQCVLVDSDGSIVLGCCGTAWCAAPGESGRSGVGPLPPDDVQALGVLLRDSFDPGTISGELALLLIRASDEDPRLRPDLTEVEAVLGTVSVEFVDPASFVTDLSGQQDLGGQQDLVGENEPDNRSEGVTSPPMAERGLRAPSPAEPTPAEPKRRVPFRLPAIGHRVGRRRLLLTAVLLTAVLIAAALLVPRVVTAVAGHSPGTTTVGVPAQVSSAQWGPLVVTLDAARAAAMTTGSPAKLAAVDDPAGPAYANDLVTMRARKAAGLTVVGGGLAVRSVTALADSAGRVLLAVTDVRAPYSLRDAGGHTVLTEPSRSLATWRLELVADPAGPGGWRVFSVVRQ